MSCDSKNNLLLYTDLTHNSFRQWNVQQWCNEGPCQIVVWMWDNLEKLNYSTSKTAHFDLETHCFRNFIGAKYLSKSSNLFNFREGRQKWRWRQKWRGRWQGGANRQRYANDVYLSFIFNGNETFKYAVCLTFSKFLDVNNDNKIWP